MADANGAASDPVEASDNDRQQPTVAQDAEDPLAPDNEQVTWKLPLPTRRTTYWARMLGEFDFVIGLRLG